MVDQERLIKSFLNYVQIDSISGKEQELAETIKVDLETLGFEVLTDDLGNLIGKLAGEITSAPTLLFCAHMDTVEPGKGVKPRRENNLIRSEGDTILGADDKAGIAAIMEGLRALVDSEIAHGDIEVVFTVMEEVGLKGAMGLNVNSLKANFGYVLDSDGPVGTIITQGPYHSKVKIYVKGRAAHAGIAPEEGISAIEVASKALARLKLGRIDKETTANIGVISGGKAINIIPDSVYLEGEVRSLNQEALALEVEKMEIIFKEEAEKLRAEIDFAVELLYPGMHVKETEAVVLLAQQAIEGSGLKPVIEATGGGSDATILNDKGIPTINLGLNMKKPHSTEEYIEVADMVKIAELVFRLIKEAITFGQSGAID